MWAVSGHAQTVFPISEKDVDVSGTVLMCQKSNIYAPCRDTGSLPLPVEFGGALNLFLPRHRETQEANADPSTAQANVDALGTALMCPSRGSTFAPCAEVGTLPLTVEGGRARKLLHRLSRRIITDTGRVIIATSIIVCGNLADGGTVARLLLHWCPPAGQVGQLGAARSGRRRRKRRVGTSQTAAGGGGDGMSTTAMSPHIARIATPPGSQLIGGRDVEIHQGALCQCGSAIRSTRYLDGDRQLDHPRLDCRVHRKQDR
jgi:hypothetical protein